ncbi:VanZ family protein [Bacillus albus]|uniref:VanZ family protein n=1 Tax=Bacillus cereus group TaxID=86661 RepID=UPI0022E822A8|nr:MULTISPECIES: VanZ family protein [Bacillus cereus group]MDA2218267.1 VanZ family protein [Bacillus cereus group sp. Bc228]MDA2228770.1 VanZ family protein [Bacillus cereus group sp. Bc227]MDA2262646.1 VanZ family protein [Bacillus cereus group sp. Bc200]MDA2324105.1 VanZ family protein [Bacillus cereus group sp. Bc177]HDR7718061.1 VanZ family protein [Bacillus albus]
MHIGVLISYLYTYFFTIIFCVVFQIGLYSKAKRNISIRHFLSVYVFLFYLSLVYKVTQIATVWDISRYETWIRINQINLTLFDTAGSTTYLLNIVLFMPLGFLLPTIWPQFRKMKNTVCAGFFFSLAIELNQLLNNRITDIDDLFTNTLGAIIGYVLYTALFKMILKREGKKLDTNSPVVIKYEAVFCLVCSFVGAMLIYYPALFGRPVIIQ